MRILWLVNIMIHIKVSPNQVNEWVWFWPVLYLNSQTPLWGNYPLSSSSGPIPLWLNLNLPKSSEENLILTSLSTFTVLLRNISDMTCIIHRLGIVSFWNVPFCINYINSTFSNLFKRENNKYSLFSEIDFLSRKHHFFWRSTIYVVYEGQPCGYLSKTMMWPKNML